jgi:hypothetical protein
MFSANGGAALDFVVHGFVEIPAGECALAFTRASPGVGDVDLHEEEVDVAEEQEEDVDEEEEEGRKRRIKMRNNKGLYILLKL